LGNLREALPQPSPKEREKKDGKIQDKLPIS